MAVLEKHLVYVCGQLKMAVNVAKISAIIINENGGAWRKAQAPNQRQLGEMSVQSASV